MPTEAHAGSPEPRRPSARTLRLVAIVAVVVALVVVVAGVLGRAHREAETRTWTDAASVPTVSVVYAKAGGAPGALTLPGTLSAWYNAPIYSRVSGYVHGWYVDIGARVTRGQLLATIDTPELDAQLVQARADLASARADMQLAQTTSARWARLLTQDAVSRQETEEKAGDLAVKTAKVNAAQANVDRLSAMKGFARIVAPFDGVVTARKTDIGALVNAGAGANFTSELFDVAEVDKLRLYVHVPQGDTAGIRPGVTATLSVPEYPGRTFPAVLTTTSNAVSDTSGTLLVELEVQNPGDVLKAGDYAEVKFDLASNGGQAGVMTLPSSALLFRDKGMEAALVGPDDHIHLQPVGVGRNLGAVIEVTSGLTPREEVVNNPPDSIENGQLVRVLSGDAAPGPAGSQGGGHAAR